MALLSPAVDTGNVGDHFVERAIRRMLGDDRPYRRLSVRRDLTADDVEQINESACAVLCGTNLYQRRWESGLTVETLARLEVPLIPIGVGSSAASLRHRRVGRTTRDMIRLLHSKCVLGSVRDPHTAEVVRRAGVRNVLLTADPVLFWSGAAEAPEIRPVKRRRLVVTARNWLMHHDRQNIDHPVQIDLLRRVLHELRDVEIVFALHEDFDARLIDMLEIPPESVFDGDRPEDFIGLYSDPDNLVFAMRLHAGMLALANGAPALFVGHDTRTYSFCEMIGTDYVGLFDEDASERCVRRLREMLDGDMSSFAALGPRYAELRQSMRRFVEANGLPAPSLGVAALDPAHPGAGGGPGQPAGLARRVAQRFLESR